MTVTFTWRLVVGIGLLILGACTAHAAPPSDYSSNLALIKATTPRNTNHDSSPWRDTPQRDLLRNDHLGPREAYLGSADNDHIIDGNKEHHYPDDEGGQFRVNCEFSHFAYDDPLVHPGKPGASHLHIYFGNTDVNAYSTYETLVNAGSSTCNGQELNRSSYWAPALFDAEGNVRLPMRIIVYYKGYGLANGRSEVYPPGSAIIADRDLHAVPSSQGGIGPGGEKAFQCSDQFRGNRSPQSNTMPVCTGAGPFLDTLEMHVKFPNCLLGDDPADPASWSTSLAGGWYYSECGGGITTPNIEYIIQYPVGESETTEGWYLASDIDPATGKLKGEPGASVHADWWGGWAEPINREWLDNCVNYDNGGVPSGCGFGYLSDAGPESLAPLPGPALKLRPGFDTAFTEGAAPLDLEAGNYKVPATSLFEQLCPTGRLLGNTAEAAWCVATGH